MRALAAAALLALHLLPTATAAEDGAVIELEVGEEKAVGGFRPVCDDPSVAWFSGDGKGILKGLKPGETTCSVSMGSPLGQRLVYRVIVHAPPPPAPDQGGRAGKDARQEG